MRFSIDIQFRPDGRFEASCAEMGLSASGESLDEVLEKIKNLVLFYVSSSEELGIAPVEDEQVLRQLSLALKDKNFCLPRNPKVH